jgi:Homeodomain-like domain-containing protein
MEAQWIADRAALRCLARQHPDWTQQELAGCLGRSRRFVKKWLKRFRQAPADDQAVLHSRSCARKTRLQDPAATGLHSRQADSSSQGGES